MKFATHILVFNQDKWLIKNINNSGPFVDKIYIAYSDVPWSYNKEARKQFINNFNPESLKNSPYYDKITFIKGVWDVDEDQRNACVSAAKKDGIDFLITHDADEFYFLDHFKNIISYIKTNSNHEVYTVNWISFWKDFKHVVETEDNKIIIGQPEICINLNKNIKFARCRNPGNYKRHLIPNILCYHASFVLTDKECYEKISTWGHTHQFNQDNWFKDKWLNWNIHTENLHPINPSIWKRAIPFTGKLPEVLQ